MKSLLTRYITHIREILEKTTLRERIIVGVLAACMISGGLGSVWFLSDRYAIDIPDAGGTITEGAIGTPRFINPVLASSDVDRDLTALVYSGLMRRGSDGVSFIPDLAEGYTVSEDGKTYTFTLKNNAVFHDGNPVTAADVAFTVEKIQDSTLKSPWRPQWINIATAVLDQKTVSFTLEKPSAGFLLATTVGILPKHRWGNLSLEEFQFSKLNSRPIGSGPYKVSGIRGKKSSPTSYVLTRFRRFILGSPYIHTIKFVFYPNETGLLKGFERGHFTNMNSFPTSYASSITRSNVYLKQRPLPRIFSVFFNPGENPILADPAILDALQTALDQRALIDNVLNGYGTPATGPFPRVLHQRAVTPTTPNIGEANAILDRAGWVRNPQTGIREKRFQSGVQKLSFTLSTSDTPELEATSHFLKQTAAALGMTIDIKLFGIGNLDHDVIRPREYEALLFGQALRYDTDFFAFWHSGERKDPGFNVALYANRAADLLLEQARKTLDSTERLALYEKLNQTIAQDAQALFLYEPHILLTFDTRIRGNNDLFIATPSDRFAHIYAWYVRTDRVWTIFINQSTVADIIKNIL